MAQLVKNPPAIQETWLQSLGWEDSLEKGKAMKNLQFPISPSTNPSHIFKIYYIFKNWATLVARLVKNPPAMQETPIQFLGREDLLEKG